MPWHCCTSIWKFRAFGATADCRRHEFQKSKTSFFDPCRACKAQHSCLSLNLIDLEDLVLLVRLLLALPSRQLRGVEALAAPHVLLSKHHHEELRSGLHLREIRIVGIQKIESKAQQSCGRSRDICPASTPSSAFPLDACISALTFTQKILYSVQIKSRPSISSILSAPHPPTRSEFRSKSPYLTTILQIYLSPMIAISSKISSYNLSRLATSSQTTFETKRSKLVSSNLMNFNLKPSNILPQSRGEPKFMETRFTVNKFSHSPFLSKPKNLNSNPSNILPQSRGEPKFMEPRLTVNKFSHSPFLARQLLICGDIETNPGPEMPTNARISSNDKKHESDLQVVSYNVRGLGDEKKCRHLINYLNRTCTNKNVDIIVALQETLIQTPLKIPYLWRGNMHLTPGTGNGRGCISLVSNHLNIISHSTIDDRAHVIALQKTGDPKVAYIVANIYAPNAHNEDKLVFFEEVLDRVAEMEERFECSNVIMLGDFNLIFEETEKVNRAFSGNEKRVAVAFGRLLREADLHDAWKVREGQRTDFTWRRPNSNSFSVLDRVMYRKTSLECLEIKSNWGVSSSDHAAVEAIFKVVNRRPRARRANIVRLDPSVLTNAHLAGRIRADFLAMYSTKDESWNPHTTLEFAKVCLRSVVERVQAERNKREKCDEEEVNSSLNRLVDRLAGVTNLEEKEELITIIEALRCRKEVIIEERGQRLAERLATKWYNEGEKSTKYFLRLLNRQAPDKLEKLARDDGTEVTDQDEINEEVVNFYRELYQNYDDSLIESADSDSTFFENLNICSPNDDLSVAEPITLRELTEVLKTCQDSSPGPDGIPYSYLRFLWDVFGRLLVEVWNFSLRTGNLAPSHKLSFLRLIPKSGKDLKLLTNWRPITLSNCDHKLITKTYSKRLIEAAGKLIDERQTAYIKGRMINDNLRTLIAAIEVANEEDIGGLIISLDAKKAFDSVEHQYIRDCLTKFGFKSFVPIFNILYNDLHSDIVVNGGIHKGYKIKRGVKQGDALSCILFIMCVEPLLRNIDNNPSIQPIHSTSLQASLPKALAYADDVTSIVQDNEASVQGIFNEYERLTRLSGLTLNADKTEILNLSRGQPRERRVAFRYLGRAFNNRSKSEIKVNGILLQMDRDRMRTGNVDLVTRKIQAQLWGWTRRGLSTLGKVLVLKTFGVSQIIYLLQTMCLTIADFKKLNAILYKFIWNRNFGAPKAPERVKREIINTPLKFGGFGMIDIQQLDRSLKLKMLSRIFASSHPFLEIVKQKINMSEFFFPSSNLTMDNPINQAVNYLSIDRQKLLVDEGVSDTTKVISLIRDIKLSSLVSATGRQSLTYFQLRRQGKIKIKDLNAAELRSIERFINVPNMVNIRKAIDLQVGDSSDSDKYLYWCKGLKPLSKLTAKNFRESQMDWQPICLYKIGAVLDPSENASWALKIKHLTSTRHKNLILKIAHGDWYSKERLHRFGLIDNPNCDSCGQLETLKHKIFECPNKANLWQFLAREEGYDLVNAPEPVEYVLGMHRHTDPASLTLHAELLQFVLYQDPTLAPERILGLFKVKLNKLDYKLRGKI